MAVDAGLRDLAPLNTQLNWLTGVTLIVHAVGAGFAAWLSHDGRGKYALSASTPPLGLVVRLAEDLSVVSLTGITLLFLGAALANARLLSPETKFLQRGDRLLLFMPPVTPFVAFGLLNRIWIASGGSLSRSRLFLIWWSLVLISIPADLLLFFGRPINLIGQFASLAPSLWFLHVARQIRHAQQTSYAASLFGEGGQELRPDEVFARTLRTGGATKKEVIDDFQPREQRRTLEQPLWAPSPQALLVPRPPNEDGG
jgi:hypothetical protein